MIVALRRALAGAALGAVLSFGTVAVSPAFAETPTPTPAATAKATATGTATAAATGTASATDTDTPDVAPDNSRQTIALGIAAAVALLAALVVFVRRT